MPSEMSTACADQNRGRTVEALERELNETHRRGIATAEVLRIIGNSPTNAQPVFDTIAASATRLCGGLYGVVFRFDGEMITVAADSAESSRASAIIRSAYPAAPGRGTMASRALLERRVIALTDAQDSVENPAGAERARAIGYRAGLSVPMLRGDMAIGAINIVRRDAIPFSENEVELLKTFADQAVIAIENTRLFEEVQARNRELRATLEQQTATSDILGVISRSVTGVQPVFDAIAESAAKLCAAELSVVARFDGEVIHLAALVLQSEQQRTAIEKLYPRKPDRATQVARAILTRRTQHVPDTTRDPAYADAPNTGFHSALAVPMLREGLPIGAVSVGRTRIGGFSDGQIELLKTFADQAVIAIENARLFEAEQASKRDLQESLEYQTATSEVLNVISRSPTELQPVLDAIAATAARLCESMDATVWRVAGGRARRVAQFGSPTSSSALPLTRGSVTGRAIVDRKTIHVHDLAAMVETEYPDVKEVQQRIGHRTTLATPLLSQGEALGAISARKNHVHPFSDRQIALLQTFADQAVIAIENARLFEEVQARTRDLTEALEQQTATSEVLEVISRSPSDLGPVLDTIVKTAARLCQAESAFIWKLEDNHFCLAAMNDIEAELAKFALQHPPPLDRKTTAGRCVLERRTIHIRDALEDSEYVWRGDEEKRIARGYRTLLGIPLLGRGEPFGAFVLIRRDVKPFTNRQIKLGVTFADQAVIAIENTRLFEEVQTRTKELQESLEYQTATSDVLGVISRSKFDLQPVLDSIVETAARLCACDMATIRGREGDVYVQLGGYGLPAEYADYSRSTNWHHAGRGSLVGRVLQEGKAVQIVDVLADPEYSLDEAQRRGGFRTMLGVPLLRGDEQLGIIVLMRRAVRPFDNRQIELVAAFADQAVIAIENTRLFEEVQARTRELATTIQELEIASQHKSQFVANMSHELRTPLAAVLGYAELLQEGIYGALPEKSLPILTRIRSNGQHLLGLINTVLDISKIEAGQFKLNVGEYALGNIVETVMVATESLAATKKLAFNMDVAKGLPYGLGDEQRLTQVLLNLVGNAIKFTDAGEVRITAGSANGYFELSVSDTGPGIPPGERERIFEKFGQVDSSNTRAKGGTGLGLAIARDIVEMHGGRIWVESKLGQGSTFRMKLPVRAAVAGSAA